MAPRRNAGEQSVRLPHLVGGGRPLSVKREGRLGPVLSSEALWGRSAADGDGASGRSSGSSLFPTPSRRPCRAPVGGASLSLRAAVAVVVVGQNKGIYSSGTARDSHPFPSSERPLLPRRRGTERGHPCDACSPSLRAWPGGRRHRLLCKSTYIFFLMCPFASFFVEVSRFFRKIPDTRKGLPPTTKRGAPIVLLSQGAPALSGLASTTQAVYP